VKSKQKYVERSGEYR